jgi:uncharacterized surface protein with fasciclin (FAS1) repeats
MKNVFLSAAALIAAVTIATPALQAAPAAGPKAPPSIADLVVSNPDIDGDGEGDFDTLLAAVQLADPSVLQRLSARGQVTVFAPTDAAFEAAFAELESLGIDPADVLADQELLTLILEYHIAPGLRTSKVVLKQKNIRMLDGGFLRQKAGQLTDNLGRKAGFEATDIRASNGVVHVINNVVLPGLP